MRLFGKIVFALLVIVLGLAVGAASIVDVDQPWAEWLKEHTRAQLWGPALSFVLAVTGVWALLRKSGAERKVDEVKKEVEALKQLTAANNALIEKALAASDARQTGQASEGPQPQGADAREALRTALEDYLRSDDPRGAQVPVLVAEQKTQEAQALARQIAEDAEAESRRMAEAGRAKAAKAWADAGAIAYMNDPQAALAAYDKARALGDESFATLKRSAILNRRLGRLDDAMVNLQAAEAKRMPEDELNRAFILYAFGSIALVRGDLVAGEDFLKRALGIQLVLGERSSQAISLRELGSVALTRGDLAAAEDFYKRALAIDRELRRQSGCAMSLGKLAEVAERRGDLAAAELFHRDALRISKTLRDPKGWAIHLGNMGVVAEKRGNGPEARRLYEKALAMLDGLSEGEG